MSQKDISKLKKTIKQLDNHRKELKMLLLVTKPISRKREIIDEIGTVTSRIAKVETVLNNIEAATITVEPPNAQDIKQIEDALNIMSTHVAKDMKWAARVKLTKATLSAARSIEQNINGRQTKDNP